MSVLDLASRTVRATYRLPTGTSPDMGNLSGDGTTLWVSSRYGEHIYAMDMRTGETTATVHVGKGPARAHRLPAARPLLPRAHRHPALAATARRPRR